VPKVLVEMVAVQGSYVFSVTAPALLSGYLNPKYVILGVTYAPPGPQSFVQYADSTTLGAPSNLNLCFVLDGHWA